MEASNRASSRLLIDEKVAPHKTSGCDIVSTPDKGFLSLKMRLQSDSGASLFFNMDVRVGSKGGG